MTSPVLPILRSVLGLCASSELASMMNEAKTTRIVRSVIEGYYADQADKDVIFDTNRTWTSQIPLLEQIFPDTRIIACVRNPAWIMDSIEQLVRRNALRRSHIFVNDREYADVFARTEAVMRPDRLIGGPLNALKEGYFGPSSGRMLLLEYDILCQRPRDAMQLVYAFLQEPWFEHDFNSVTYSADEFDIALNTPGLHKVRRKVSWSPRETVLPPEIFNRLAGLAFWREDHKTHAKRLTQAAPPVSG